MGNNLTIVKAKSKREQLENELDLRLKEKELIFNKTQPKSKELIGEVVNGGNKRVDKFANYVIKDEELDNIIDLLQEEIKIYDEYICKELERLNKYNEWEQKVIMYRESKNSWLWIACHTPFSISTCKRIYRKYKNVRNVVD